jgi:NADH dehydrogenase/NADH:ubiquinone oxidoreductase subunit G
MEFPFTESTKAKKKSRKGSVPMNVETLMKQDRFEKGEAKLSSLQFRAFAEALQEKLAFGAYNPTPRAPLAGTRSAAGIQRAPVSTEEALEAAKVLQQAKGKGKHLEAAGISGVAAPLITGASRAVKGFVDTKGSLRNRLAGAAKEVGTSSLGDVAAQATAGGLTGGILSASREGLQAHKAKKKIRTFLEQHQGSARRKRRAERALQI